ncbi:MAG: hypothetical protein ACKVOR_09100 [Flavobacteriales bacterium]
MMKQLGICTLLMMACASNKIAAQKVMMKRNVTRQIEETYLDSSGPNGRVYVMNYYGYGIILPMNDRDSAAITDNAKSNIFTYGVKAKFKLNNTFALCTDIIYMHQRYKIAQHDSLNIFSPGFKNDVQKLNFNTFGLGAHLRINFGKRGNALGKYLDLGADMHYVFAERLFTKNKITASGTGADEIVQRTTLKKLDYTGNLQGFANVHFGINIFQLFARYRLTDMFVRSDSFYSIGRIPELPRLCVGVEILIPTE